MIVDRYRYGSDGIFRVKQKNLFYNLLLCGKKYIDSEGNVSVRGNVLYR